MNRAHELAVLCVIVENLKATPISLLIGWANYSPRVQVFRMLETEKTAQQATGVSPQVNRHQI